MRALLRVCYILFSLSIAIISQSSFFVFFISLSPSFPSFNVTTTETRFRAFCHLTLACYTCFYAYLQFIFSFSCDLFCSEILFNFKELSMMLNLKLFSFNMFEIRRFALFPALKNYRGRGGFSCAHLFFVEILCEFLTL